MEKKLNTFVNNSIKYLELKWLNIFDPDCSGWVSKLL